VRGCRAGEQLLVARSLEAAPGVGHALELGLDLLEAPGLRLERSEEAAQRGGHFPDPHLGFAELAVRLRKLGRECRNGREARRGLGHELACSFLLPDLGCKRLAGGCSGLSKLRHVQQALPLRAQTFLSVGLETLRALDQLLQLDQPLGAAHLGVGELVPPAPCGH